MVWYTLQILASILWRQFLEHMSLASHSSMLHIKSQTNISCKIMHQSAQSVIMQFVLEFLCPATLTFMGACRNAQGEATAPPPWNVVFLCISRYCKMLSKQNIYALFSQTVVGFWGLHPRPPPGLHPWNLMGDFRPRIPNLPTPAKKILRVPMLTFDLKQHNSKGNYLYETYSEVLLCVSKISTVQP